MFQDFANVWTPVQLSRRVKKKPVKVTVAGEELVLFRGAGGRVAALLDRCPHRGVSLSLGEVTADGTLACPFHGWEFGAAGDCAHVPYAGGLPAEKRARLGATALPTREIAGLIFVRTSPGVEAPDEPHISAPLLDPAYRLWHHEEVWNCHWTRAMENMLDAPHLPFVHRTTIGAGMRRQLTAKSVMEVGTRKTATGAAISWSVDGDRSGEEMLSFHRPNQMVLHLKLPMGPSPMHVYCVPVDATHTRMVIVAARGYGKWNPLFRLTDQFNRIIVNQDKQVVESSQPPEVPRPAEEASVASDKGTLVFRRYYFDALKGSSTASPTRLVALKGPAANDPAVDPATAVAIERRVEA